MFKQVVVGVDGHEGARDAIALAISLLAPDGDLILGNVCAGDPHIYRAASVAYEAARRAQARELLEQARNQSGVDAHLESTRSASVGAGLHKLCAAADADLLVVGSSRRGPLGRVLLGDDTCGALDRAPCAVAIAPAGYRHEPVAMREIGVGYDGSPGSKLALEAARELAAEAGAKLSAFQAASLPSIAFSGALMPLNEAVEMLVEDARSEVERLGVEPHVAFGQPAEELAVYSASLDLLVMGSHGYGPIRRLIHGSTTRHLASIARCPLLVLPAGKADTAVPSADRREATAPAGR